MQSCLQGICDSHNTAFKYKKRISRPYKADGFKGGWNLVLIISKRIQWLQEMESHCRCQQHRWSWESGRRNYSRTAATILDGEIFSNLWSSLKRWKIRQKACFFFYKAVGSRTVWNVCAKKVLEKRWKKRS